MADPLTVDQMSDVYKQVWDEPDKIVKSTFQMGQRGNPFHKGSANAGGLP